MSTNRSPAKRQAITPKETTRPTAKQRLEAKRARSRKKAFDREYHVVWDGDRKRFNVETDDGRSIGFHSRESGAVTAAVQAAHHDYAEGINAIVCVQQKTAPSRSNGWAKQNGGAGAMDNREPVLERAFAHASGGKCRTIDDIKMQLRSDGYSGQDILQIAGRTLARQLNGLLAARKAQPQA